MERKIFYVSSEKRYKEMKKSLGIVLATASRVFDTSDDFDKELLNAIGDVSVLQMLLNSAISDNDK